MAKLLKIKIRVVYITLRRWFSFCMLFNTLDVYVVVFVHHFLYPRREFKHVCVDTIFVGSCTFVAPGNDSCKVKAPVILAWQWPSTVVLACVHPSFFESSTQSPAVDGSIVGLDTITNLGRYQTNFGLSQDVGFGAIPLGVAPTSYVALLSPGEFYLRMNKADWRNVTVIHCCFW